MTLWAETNRAATAATHYGRRTTNYGLFDLRQLRHLELGLERDAIRPGIDLAHQHPDGERVVLVGADFHRDARLPAMLLHANLHRLAVLPADGARELEVPFPRVAVVNDVARAVHDAVHLELDRQLGPAAEEAGHLLVERPGLHGHLVLAWRLHLLDPAQEIAGVAAVLPLRMHAQVAVAQRDELLEVARLLLVVIAYGPEIAAVPLALDRGERRGRFLGEGAIGVLVEIDLVALLARLEVLRAAGGVAAGGLDVAFVDAAQVG